jgi:hypothetical protein
MNGDWQEGENPSQRGRSAVASTSIAATPVAGWHSRAGPPTLVFRLKNLTNLLAICLLLQLPC